LPNAFEPVLIGPAFPLRAAAIGCRAWHRSKLLKIRPFATAIVPLNVLDTKSPVFDDPFSQFAG
jgi:hypothetical protein